MAIKIICCQKGWFSSKWFWICNTVFVLYTVQAEEVGDSSSTVPGTDFYYHLMLIKEGRRTIN
jgi:hypothetical protein